MVQSSSVLFGSEISVATAARIARCSQDTILRMLEDGKLEGRRLGSRGWWRIDYNSLIEFMNGQLTRRK